MDNVIIIRSFVAVGLLLSAPLLVWMLSSAVRHLSGNRQPQRPVVDLNEEEVPVLMLFSTSTCPSCTPQKEHVMEMAKQLHRRGFPLDVRHVDALREFTLASSMHVLTVPTTILLSPSGETKAWNPGFVSSRKLLKQYREAFPFLSSEVRNFRIVEKWHRAASAKGEESPGLTSRK